jgi:phosphotransferase system  glucose/maltose/N-acetylglucosamine-specific IIC component
MRERWLAGCCVAAALAAAWVLWDQLGIRSLTEHVPQQYGPGDLILGFVGALVIWLGLHAASLAYRSRTLQAVNGAALALAVGAVAYLHWPRSEDNLAYFVRLTDTSSRWARDVALLLLSLGAGFALPTVFALRRQLRRDA